MYIVGKIPYYDRDTGPVAILLSGTYIHKRKYLALIVKLQCTHKPILSWNFSYSETFRQVSPQSNFFITVINIKRWAYFSLASKSLLFFYLGQDNFPWEITLDGLCVASFHNSSISDGSWNATLISPVNTRCTLALSTKFNRTLDKPTLTLSNLGFCVHADMSPVLMHLNHDQVTVWLLIFNNKWVILRKVGFFVSPLLDMKFLDAIFSLLP